MKLCSPIIVFSCGPIGLAHSLTDGGGPSKGRSDRHPVPTRKSDLSVPFHTRPDQALLFRLNGDLNPLHSSPRMAKREGFPRPIPHGLCTFGITCRAVLQEFHPTEILSHQARSSAPVFPGDTITVDPWRDGDEISIVAGVIDRGATVIKNGKAVLRDWARVSTLPGPTTSRI